MPAEPAIIRVLVVDDSATMRALIVRALQTDPGLVVVGQASCSHEAQAAIKALNPNVVTLDIEMPEMNGLDFLERLMRLRPLPVVMVSNLTRSGAVATLRALELGAVDCVAKPIPGAPSSDDAGFARLAEIVRAAATARLRPLRHAAPPRAPAGFSPGNHVLAIGASTGGVEALLAILSAFPPNCPPTVITQHMPAAFTLPFAERLDRSCNASVGLAVDGAPLAMGKVYLAPGGFTHLEVSGPAHGPWRCRLSDSGPVNGHRPSVDVLFRSVAKAANGRAVGVILTGMGRDGAHGLMAMRQAGARTLGQDEASSVIYGMPRAAFESGGVQRQVTLHAMSAAILAACAAPAMPAELAIAANR